MQNRRPQLPIIQRGSIPAGSATNGALLLILLVAFVLRVINDNVELHVDEPFSCVMAVQSFSSMVGLTFEIKEPHPVGYYLLLQGWDMLAGYTWFAQRFLSIFCGVAAVALVARLCRQMLGGNYGRNVGVVAAALLAVNSLSVWQSRELRMYAVLLTLTLASTLLLLFNLHRNQLITLRHVAQKPSDHPERVEGDRTVSERNSSVRTPRLPSGALLWLAYIFITWLVLQMHYYAVFVVVAQNMYVACLLLFDKTVDRRRLLTRWVIAQLIVIAFTLPWLYLVRDILLGYHGNGSMPSVLEALTSMLVWFTVGANQYSLLWLFAAIGGLLFVIGLIRLCLNGSQQRRAALLLVFYFAVPVVAIWWLSQTRPVFMARYLITSLAPFQIIMAAALVPGTLTVLTGWRRAVRVVATAAAFVIVCVTAAGLLMSDRNYFIEAQDYGRSQFEGTYEAMQQYSGGLPPSQVRWAVTSADYYFSCALHTSDYAVIPYKPNDQAAADEVVRQFAGTDVRRVLVAIVSDPWWNGQTVAPAALSKEYTQIAEASTGTWPLKVYSRMPAQALQKIAAVFKNGVALDGAKIVPDVRGQLLEVHLQWGGSTAGLTGDEKLFIHVSGLQTPDQVATQLDVPFTAGDLSQPVRTYAAPLPHSLPAGQYRVTVGLYHGNRPDLPRVLTTGGADQIELGQFNLP
jgi:uncharacterized membrane protein